MMKQKIGVGANPKSNKAIQEFAQRKLEQTNQEEKIKVRIAKMSLGTVVKWKRKKRKRMKPPKKKEKDIKKTKGRKATAPER